jgi:hypothetical protein
MGEEKEKTAKPVKYILSAENVIKATYEGLIRLVVKEATTAHNCSMVCAL